MTEKVLVGALIVFGFTFFVPVALFGIAYATLTAVQEF